MTGDEDLDLMPRIGLLKDSLLPTTAEAAMKRLRYLEEGETHDQGVGYIVTSASFDSVLSLCWVAEFLVVRGILLVRGIST